MPILRSRLLWFQETNYRAHTNYLFSVPPRNIGRYYYRLVEQLRLKGTSWGYPVQHTNLKSQSQSSIRLTSYSFSFLIGIPTFCNFRYLFLVRQIGAERGRDELRALTFVTDHIRGLNFVDTSISDPFTHADLNNKQCSTLSVYTVFLCFDKLCSVLLHE